MTLDKSETRYNALRTLAQSKNHQVRVVVFPKGKPIEPGELLTVVPLLETSGELKAAMDVIDEYLQSDEATARGELQTRLEDAQQDVKDLEKEWDEAAERLADIEKEVRADQRERVNRAKEQRSEQKEQLQLPPELGAISG